MNIDNTSAFSRLAPFLREYVHTEKWPHLRKIQEKAIEAIFDSENHLLIASGTASGKTEAAFLPLLSVLALIAQQSPSNAVRPLALCISPLKALINDQYARLEKMLRNAPETASGKSVPLWKWHGDVSENRKKKFLAEPGGVLIITPESLEALLLLNARDTARIFAGLCFVVIDEVHSFMESERGLQIQCQLSRIASALPENQAVRRIGLSATLWDYGGAAEWLARGTSLPVAVVSDEEKTKRTLRLAVDYFENDADLYHALFAHSRGKRAVIFAQGRSDTEESISALQKIARESGEKESFRIHHGSVAAHLRLDAEENLRSGEGPQTTVATSTLELGIDIGGLDRVIQVGPPASVSTFVQRLGRSGRKNNSPEMCFCIKKEKLGDGLASVAWDLLKTIAVVELYLGERWIEPPPEKKFPASMLVHEILAVLHGGEKSAASLRSILRRAPFADTSISAEDFSLLLRHLLKCGYIEKTEEGKIILGLAGEKIVNRRSFYTAFPGDEFFRVLFEGREIGTVNFVPEAGSVIAVAGRLWTVAGADAAHREVDVKEAGGSASGENVSEGLWRGSGAEIHSRVAEKVKEILSTDKKKSYAYLSPAAQKALEESRAAAKKFNLLSPVAAAPRKSGDTFTRYFLNLYLGSSGMRAVAAFLRMGEAAKRLSLSKFDGILVNDENDFCFEAASKIGADEFPSIFQNELERFFSELAESPETAAERIGKKQIPFADKYDYLLPPELLEKSYALNLLSLSTRQK